MSLVAAFFFRHSGTTFAALADLLQLLNTILPGCIISSLYLFKKLFFKTDSVLMHFYCTKCETYLGTEEKSYNCSGCKLQMDFQECKKARCFFMTSSIANQLRDMLEGTTLFSKISAGKQHMGKDKKAEILTGDGYKDPKIQKFLAVKENFSMTFSSDGVNVFNSNKDSLWPIFLSINELNLNSSRSIF